MTVTRQDAPAEEVPAALRGQVRLLGDVLGQVLTEAGGPGLLADVERLRRATIDLRAEPSGERAQAVADVVAGFGLERAEQVARAFTLYFQLINLAEEHHRVRALREQGRCTDVVADSLADAVERVAAREGRTALDAVLHGLRITPVLTAHPTEARRRAVTEALQRVAGQLARLDDPGPDKAGRADVRRRLLEEVAGLWRTAQVRGRRPEPLDEVRRVMAVFDETLFRVVPAVYRELDRALAPADVGARPPAFPAFLRWASWVGGDRDGNPRVTAEVTRETLGIQAEHVLRGLEAATRRIARSLTVSSWAAPPSPALLAGLAADEERFSEAAAGLLRRVADEPHRRRLALCAQRLAATRTGGPGRYDRSHEFVGDLAVLQESLAGAGAARLAYGEVQHLRWQAETFGFQLASLEVRQHSGTQARVLSELAPEAVGDAAECERLSEHGWPSGVTPRSEAAREALSTLRTMADLQRRYGPGACCRYVVSFTRGAADVLAVRALARLAVPDGSLELDVVPLFETRAALREAPRVLDELLTLPGERARLAAGGRRLEVMLGYSDSAKEVGFLAANLLLYDAQAALADWARRNDVALTLFHGRGGAVGRGGGPTNRAVRGQAPGSVAGRFKLTEQGEVINARYRDMALARRHLEQVTNAVILASTPAAERGRATVDPSHERLVARMSQASEAAFRALVEADDFVGFFTRVTPVREIGELQIASRPSRRGSDGGLESLRAIPWVFAWAQSRCNLPGWFGLGTGLRAAAGEEGGLDALRAMYRQWPFFTSLLENAEMSLVKADPLIAERYLAMGNRPDLSARIIDEFELTHRLVLDVTGHDRLLAPRGLLRRAVQLRNPYVDALSFLQAHWLWRLRSAGDTTGERVDRMRELVQLTVNGVAAGLQNTG
ncbi:MAG: phosphoenolpyruvate carboxylase [Actinobacteria bacterium]|nr:phosphoenolpyruvate carboxylase [Actinomycetota bacterium]